MAQPFLTDLQTRRVHDRLREDLAAEVARIAAVRQVRPIVIAAVERAKVMSKLAAVADRIRTKKETHDAKADEWGARLDALDRREPEAFAVGDAVIAEREDDLAGMERDLRALSNLPLAGSGRSGSE